MELGSTGRLKRSSQLSQSTAARAENTALKKTVSIRDQSRADRLALSRQAVAFLEENNRRIQEQIQLDAEKKNKDNKSTASDGGASNLLDSLDKAMDVMRKCQKIAAAIMKGKRVPPEDLRYLMEHDPNGYKMAMAMRKPEKDDEEVESVLDEEDLKGESAPKSSESCGMSAPTSTASSAESASGSGGESGDSPSAE